MSEKRDPNQERAQCIENLSRIFAPLKDPKNEQVFSPLAFKALADSMEDYGFTYEDIGLSKEIVERNKREAVRYSLEQTFAKILSKSFPITPEHISGLLDAMRKYNFSPEDLHIPLNAYEQMIARIN